MRRRRVLAGAIGISAVAALAISAMLFLIERGDDDGLPPYNFVRITSVDDSGSLRLVPVAAGYKPKLSARDAIGASMKIQEAFSGPVRSSSRLLVRLGSHEAGSAVWQDEWEGRRLYVITGERAISCHSTGGPPGRPSPETGVCRWALYLDADTGEFVAYSTDAMPRTKVGSWLKRYFASGKILVYP